MLIVTTDLHCFDDVQEWLDNNGVAYDREGGFDVSLTFTNHATLKSFLDFSTVDPKDLSFRLIDKR